MRITLYKQEGATRVHIDAEVKGNGDLEVGGHDIGEAPKKWWGHDDYEYIVTIRRPHKERLLLALKAAAFSDDAATESQLQDLARQKNVPYKWFKRDKDHLLLALIAVLFGNDSSAVSRFRDFASENDIPYEWFSWP